MFVQLELTSAAMYLAIAVLAPYFILLIAGLFPFSTAPA